MKARLLVPLCFVAGVGGAWLIWPTPRPPLKVLTAYAARAPIPRCTDRKVLTLLGQMEQPRYWHMQVGSHDWLTSRAFNVTLYMQTDGALTTGSAETQATETREPDIDPVCRWALDIAFKRLGEAMGPETDKGPL